MPPAVAARAGRAGPVGAKCRSRACAPSTSGVRGGSRAVHCASRPGAAARSNTSRCPWAGASGSWCRFGSPSRWRTRCGGMRPPSRAEENAAQGGGWQFGLRLWPEAALELTDQAFELADPLAEGGVLGEEPSERGSGLLVALRAPGRDAAARGADALRPAARQGAAADRAQPGLWRRTYVTRRDFGPGDRDTLTGRRHEGLRGHAGRVRPSTQGRPRASNTPHRRRTRGRGRQYDGHLAPPTGFQDHWASGGFPLCLLFTPSASSTLTFGRPDR